MKWIELQSEIRNYKNKIIKEDLCLLKTKKHELDTISWEVYMDKYNNNFIRKNRLLFEILISETIPFNQMSRSDIISMSLKSTKQTLDCIINNINKCP